MTGGTAAPRPRALAPLAAAALAGLALHVALSLGALAALPQGLRLGLAFAAFVFTPGTLLAASFASPPGGAWLSAVRALAFGVLWNVGVLGALTLAGRSLHDADVAWPVATTALAALVLAHVRRRAAPEAAPSLGERPAALALVAVAVLLVAWHVGSTGTQVSYYSDSPDHIATVRRIAESGVPFPTDAFFADAGAEGGDPRKGWWHAEVAHVARLARVDATDAWVGLSAWIAPFFVLNAAALGWLAAGPKGAAVNAIVFALFWIGNLTWVPFRKAVFGTFLTDQIALAAAIAVLDDLGRRARATRATAVLLCAAAAGSHVYAAIQFALTFGATGAALVLRRGPRDAAFRRFAGTVALAALACAIVLLPRALTLDRPDNVIHTEPQGLMTLWGAQRVVMSGVLTDWMQWLWIPIAFALPYLWRRAAHDPAALYAAAVPVGVALVIFDPLAVGVLEPKLGYLLMRMVWMVPVATVFTLAWLGLHEAWRRGGARRRIAAALAALALLACAKSTLQDAALALAHPRELVAAEADHGPQRWAAPMAWMRAHLAADAVVLSDPATSYAVPMMTGRRVVCLLDQHSSPSDSRALARLLEARDALDPYGSWARLAAVVRRYRVSTIVLNGDFSEIPSFAYWSPSPGWFAAARARLDGAPGAFERIHDRGRFVVYGVRAGALDTLSTPVPARPFVTAWDPERWPPGRRAGEGMPLVLRFSVVPRVASPGDTVLGIADWRAPERLPAGSYRVPVRFDAPLPGGFEPPAWIAKPARKVFELTRGARWRFRSDHLPVDGRFAPDLWTPDLVVRDSFRVAVPPDVADGRYEVQIRMRHSAIYPNYRLSDYFSDDDYYSGVPVGTFDVRRAPAR